MRYLRNGEGRARFDFVTIQLHWLTVTLIALQAATGLTLQYAHGVPVQPLLAVHRSGGALVWCVALARLLWRATFARFPAFPDWMSGAQKWIATRTEYALYALLLFQPLTGLATTLMLGKPFALLLWTVPAILPRNLELWQMLFAAHRVGAYCLFAIIAGHAGMALLHHYVFGDEVLARMAPWVRRRVTALPAARGAKAARSLRRERGSFAPR